MRHATSILLTAVVSLTLTAAATAGIKFQTDRLGYTGSIKRFASFEDAVNNVNAVSTYALANRDAQLYFTQGLSGVQDANIFSVAWYYTNEPNSGGVPKDSFAGDNYYSGLNNPNNTPVGLVQLYDADGSTDTQMSAAWSDFDGAAYHTLNFSARGENAANVPESSSNDQTKVWAGQGSLLTSDSLVGTMLEWAIDVTVTGVSGTGEHPISAKGHPTGGAGSFYALFYNDNPIDETLVGYYGVYLSLNLQNWAFAQGNAALNGNFRTSNFSVAPAPSAAAAGLMLLATLATHRRRSTR